MFVNNNTPPIGVRLRTRGAPDGAALAPALARRDGDIMRVSWSVALTTLAGAEPIASAPIELDGGAMGRLTAQRDGDTVTLTFTYEDRARCPLEVTCHVPAAGDATRQMGGATGADGNAHYTSYVPVEGLVAERLALTVSYEPR